MANATADLIAEPTPVPGHPAKGVRSDPWRIAWNILAGDTLLVCALLAIALLLGAAAWLPQAPDSVTAPVAYSRWLAETQARFGNSAALLRQTGLLSLERSPALGVLMALATLSLIVRWMASLQAAWSARHFQAPPPEGGLRLDAAQTSELSLDDVATALRRRHWRISREGDALRADRFPLADMALIAAYVGALLVIVSLVISHVGGWRARDLTLGVGQAPTPIGHGTPYSLRLDALDQATVGHVELSNETDVISEGNLALGQPMQSAGLAVFIKGTGPAIRASAAFTDGQPLRLQTSAASTPATELVLLLTHDEPDRIFAAPDAGLVIRLSRGPSALPARAQVRRSRTGEVVFDGDIPSDGRVSVENAVLTFGTETYAVLDVVRDPGLPVAVAGTIVLAIGLAVVLFWPVKRLWAIADTNGTRLAGDVVRLQVTDSAVPGENAARTLWKRLSTWLAWARFAWRIGLVVLSALVGLATALSLTRAGTLWPMASAAPAFLAAWLTGCTAAILLHTTYHTDGGTVPTVVRCRALRWTTLMLAAIALVAVLIQPGLLTP